MPIIHPPSSAISHIFLGCHKDYRQDPSRWEQFEEDLQGSEHHEVAEPP